jgi:hypothetical protein
LDLVDAYKRVIQVISGYFKFAYQREFFIIKLKNETQVRADLMLRGAGKNVPEFEV